MSDEMPDVIYANKDQDCYRQGQWRDDKWGYMPNDFTLIDAEAYVRYDTVRELVQAIEELGRHSIRPDYAEGDNAIGLVLALAAKLKS